MFNFIFFFKAVLVTVLHREKEVLFKMSYTKKTLFKIKMMT